MKPLRGTLAFDMTPVTATPDGSNEEELEKPTKWCDEGSSGIGGRDSDLCSEATVKCDLDRGGSIRCYCHESFQRPT